MVTDPNPHYDPEDIYGIGAVTDPVLDDHTPRDERECPRYGQPMPTDRDRCEDCQFDHSTETLASESQSPAYEWQADRVAVVHVDEPLATLAQAFARTAIRRRDRDGSTPSRSKQSVRLLDDLGTLEQDHLGSPDWREIDALAKADSADANALIDAIREQNTDRPVFYDADGDPLDEVGDVDNGWLVAGVLRTKTRTLADCPTRVLKCHDCGPGPHAHRGRERADTRVDDPLVTGANLWTCKRCRRTRTGPPAESETGSRDREWPDTTAQERAHEEDAIGTEMVEYIETHRRN
ncbi:hypothetical protein [Halorubellus litoreus]|uniref:Uncharacterized protein n=1 Tax=Halorubellus litoreus TaxID=755308 RepID=A0ABD5VHA6_9EURY